MDRDGRPAYAHLAESLRGAIADGTYPVGSRLPSTSQLTAHHGVSLTTARRALEVLRHEGLVIGQQGAGVFVRAVPDEVPVGSVTQRLSALEAAREEDRKLLGILEARLIELYSKTGHAYPGVQPEGRRGRRTG